MTSPSFAEQVTASFYAWEVRGRGWQCAPAPVSIEPVYRPFFLLPQHVPQGVPALACQDDGRRPTLLSSLIESVGNLFSSRSVPLPTPVEPYTEQNPFPAFPRSAFVTYRIRTPEGWKSDPTVAGKLLTALSAAQLPLCFEWVGAEGEVGLQVACDAMDADRVRSTLAAYCPDATVVEEDDRLVSSWNADGARFIVDVGLANEFFLPLAGVGSFAVDPLIALVAALAEAEGHGECAAFQVLFERVRNPWPDATMDALDDGSGGCIFSDAPEFPSLATEKTETPFFAVVVRLAAAAWCSERALALLRGMGGFLLQFARPGSNELVPLENTDYPEARRERDLLERESCRTGMLLSTEELMGLVHLPDVSVRHSALTRDVKRTKGVPAVLSGERGLCLGLNCHRGEAVPVVLPEMERLQHLHVIGASGTGKSTLLINLILQDIALGTGVAVLDPHGDLVDDIIARIPEEYGERVILFDPADEDWPIGFNIFAAASERERTLLASDLVGIFERLSSSWGDTMSAVLGNAVLAMLAHEEGGTLLDLRRFLIDEGFRKTFLAGVTDLDVRFFWEKEFAIIGSRSIGPLLTRLDALLRPKLIKAIVGQAKARLDLGSVMEAGHVFLAKLPQGMIGEENAALLGSLLMSKFHQLALGRQALAKGKRRPFFLYADECQHFVTPSVAALLTEGRKYGLGLTLAHQGLAQLEDVGRVKSAILGAHTRIVFRLSDDDAKALASGFAFFDADDLKRLGRGEAIARSGAADHDFNLRTVPLESVSGDVAASRQEAVIAYSRECYAVPLSELRQEWAERYGTKEVATAEAVVTMEVRETVPAVEEPKPAAHPPLAEPAPRTRRQAVPPPEPAPMGRGGREHKYLQHLIKRLAEERGFRALIEEAAGDGRADVVLRKDTLSVACEISITTDVEHEIGNLKKCLVAGFTRILFVSPDKKRRQKVGTWIKGEPPAVPIDVIDPEGIVAALDALTVPPQAAETTVRGYKVKVTRQAVTPEDVAGVRSLVAQVIARSMRKRD